MAQLLAPSAPGPGRISQILPTVKCSSCNQPVPISELGDHVCAPAPAANLKPPGSPRSATFLAQKYQNVVARSQTPPLSPSSTAPSRNPSPLGTQPPRNNPMTQTPAQRTRQSSTSSSYSVSSRTARSPGPNPRDDYSDGGKIAFPTRSGPESPRTTPLSSRQAQSMRSGSSISSRTSSSSSSQPQSPPLSRAPLEQAIPRAPNQSMSSYNNPGARARAPSNASVRSAVPTIRQPIQSSPTPYAPPRPGASQLSGLSPTASRPRAATNAGDPPPFQTGPDDIYSTTSNRPGADVPPQMQASPAPSMTPSMNGNSSSGSQMREDIDTKIGGEAGMAGVGRRGFAAAARAALFANNFGPSRDDPFTVVANMDAVQGMDGRRANAPTFLDISSVTNYANTPPLSPNSASSHSPHSPLSVTLPSPSKESGRGSTTPTPTIASRTPSPGLGRRSIGERVIPPAPEPPKDPLPATPTGAVRLPFFEKFKNMHTPVSVTPPAPVENDASPLSPGSSESSYGGLAYADSDDDEDDKVNTTPASAPAATNSRLSQSTMLGSAPPPPPKTAEGTSKVRFPSISSSRSSRSEYDTVSPPLPKRSLSASTAYSIRSAAKSTGALDRTMETLLEEDTTAQTAASTSSPALLGLGENPRDSKPPKLPMRSHTSPTLGAGRPDSRHGIGKKRPKVRVCAKCDKQIDDGRWIQMDGGTVLCDKCWKNMYLPKCRRCKKTIEKAAVSSSDGQLKGKYHRECFSCYTCQKPFPDKSFYVFDGKPFCAYHYHEANDSLCAATTCGQPIEGSCAISHSGDKYHPEHFTCEWRGCKERLAEYWEVDGRMLCDKHAQTAMRSGEFDDKDPLDGLDSVGDDEKRDSRALRVTKRTTRFIDLASFNASGVGGGDSGLR